MFNHLEAIRRNLVVTVRNKIYAKTNSVAQCLSLLTNLPRMHLTNSTCRDPEYTGLDKFTIDVVAQWATNPLDMVAQC